MRFFGALTLLVAACGGSSSSPDAHVVDAPQADASPPDAFVADASRDIGYPAIGSIVAPSGASSFRFGAASSAMQIEDMNPNVDWYIYTEPTAAGGMGQGAAFVGDASMGYSMALADVALLQALHVDSYRFSLEWARIEPSRGVFDPVALQHYDDFIDALIAAGIKPMITLHHYANPIWVDDPRDPNCNAGPSDANLCGWGHPVGGPMVVTEFANFASVVGARYGDRVDEWTTENEPISYLVAAYGVGTFAPGKSRIFNLIAQFGPTMRDYLAGHAAAYDALKAADTIDADGDGVAAAVGVTLSVAEWVPAKNNMVSTDPVDITARDKVKALFHYSWPDDILQGKFDANFDGTAEEDHPEWRGKLDWLGVQYYFRTGVTGTGSALVPVLNVIPCMGGFDFGSCVPPTDPTFVVPVMGYEYYPPGLYDALIDLGTRYPQMPLVVTESGIATLVGERRAESIVRSLEQIQRARQDGVDVRGYYHWSLYDNFEFISGFTPRFGLYTIDYSTYARTPTLGADVLGQIANARLLTAAQRDLYGGNGPMTPEP
jgi:beta-glucosidase